jgi:hypothetical protein
MGRTVDTPITQKPVPEKVDYESVHPINLQKAVRDLDARLKLTEKK